MKTLPLKTNSSAVTFTAFLVAFLALATSVFGQTIYTWTGAGDGVSLANSTNWDPNGLPSGATQDTAMWDGRTTTNLVITYGLTSLPSTGFGSSGINLNLTANQHQSVQIISSVPVSAGVGINNVTLDAGAAAFSFGDDSTNRLKGFGRPAGAIHLWVNNSANPGFIGSSVEWQAGGGNGYTYEFGGTGDWIVHSYLYPDNGAFSPSVVQVDGPGSVFWSAGVIVPNSPVGPTVINGGRLVIQSAGVLTANQGIVNNATLTFDAPAQSQTLNGIISGTGELIVTNGTLTLSGQSTYTGNTILAGGELKVNGAEDPTSTFGPLGVGGTISFSGGTLGFSVNNIFDYSPRFSTAAGQAYSFDTAGQNVTFTNAAGLTSSGGTLTKLGSGTLTLAGANSYSGLTTVSVGELVIQGTKTGSGNITVADGAAFGVFATGTQVTPGTLTLGTSGDVTLEFNNVNSTTTAPLAAGTLSAAGTVTINVLSGTFTPGQSYPLLTWTTGPAPAVSLGLLNGFIGNLATNGNTIQVNITATAYKWTGITDGNWDLSTANNWLQNGGAVVFANGGPALFDDTSSRTNVTVNALVQPTTVTVSTTNAYSIASSGGNNLGGNASVLKSGAGSLTLSGGANTYTGPTTIGAGTLSVGALANGGAASDIGAASSGAANLVLNGGTLQYTGSGASIDRLFTLGTGGGTIEDAGSGALVFNGTGPLAYIGNGPRALTLTGADTDNNTLAANLADNGGPTSLTKSGAGLWILTGTNTYSGGTTIAGGALQVGNGGASGALGSGSIVNDSSLSFNRTGTVTVNGAVTGTGSVAQNGSGTVVLAGNNTYSGGTTINAGTLQVGSGGSSGKLDGNSVITNNGTLIFNSSGAFTLNAGSSITGSGNLRKQGSGLLMLRGNESYNGWTLIDSGANLQIFSGNEGSFSGTGVITNNGTLIVVRQDNGVAGITNNIVGTGKLVKDSNNPNNGDVTLMGTNTYTGGTFINGGGIVLGDGLTVGAGSIVGNVTMTNFSLAAGNPSASSLTFSRPSGDDLTFSGNITGAGSVVQNGFNTVTLTGTNTYSAGTTINQATLQVGNGGTSGSIGTGNVTDGGTLVWNRSDDVTFAGTIADGGTGGFGSLVQMGVGTVTLTATNTYTGATTVSNGTLVVAGGSVGGDLNVNGGTIAAAPSGTVGTLNVVGFMNINSGGVQVTLNKGLAQSNTLYSAAAIIAAGGTVKVQNAGPTLAVNDKFTLFNQPVSGGAALTVTGGGATWNNNLATDGSISVATVLVVTPPTLNVTNTGSGLQFSWTNSGFKLQAQTNSLNVGISTNWVDYPGGGASPVTAPIGVTNGTVFFRLISTP